MKRRMTLISVAVIFTLLFAMVFPSTQIAKAGFLWDPCKPFPLKPSVQSIAIPFIVFGPTPGLPEAPEQHEDGRLNYRVCRAPLAIFMNEDGSVEVWSTDDENMYAPLALEVSATADEIATALALAEETGQDVVIAGYVDGFALIAKPDGTLKAELIGEYGCDFEADGGANYGWCLGFEGWEWTIIGPLPEN